MGEVKGSYVVRNIAIKEDVPFVLRDGEKILDASYDAPYVYLIVLSKAE